MSSLLPSPVIGGAAALPTDHQRSCKALPFLFLTRGVPSMHHTIPNSGFSTSVGAAVNGSPETLECWLEHSRAVPAARGVWLPDQDSLLLPCGLVLGLSEQLCLQGLSQAVVQGTQGTEDQDCVTP